MDDFVDDFEEMGMDARRNSTSGGPQGRRGTGRRFFYDMDGLDEEDSYPRRASTRVGPQERRDTRRRHLDDMDVFDEEETNPRRPSAGGGPQGKRDIKPRHLDNMDGFEGEDIYPRRPSARGGAQGIRGAGPRYMDEISTDMVPYVAGSGYGSKAQTAKPPTAKSKPSLDKLEAELDVVEMEQERLGDKIMQIKMEIYKIDPESERVDDSDRSFLHLPSKGNRNHEERGHRHDRRGPAPVRGGYPDRGAARHREHDQRSGKETLARAQVCTDFVDAPCYPLNIRWIENPEIPGLVHSSCEIGPEPV
ncbi:hypothetical protein HO173_009209 [Letharia columbiana]|uniref:Uncharacterized protein n=1 Tax=Letharia columbiana TaxID=112416 RepID=A0A8H6FQ08_9LECA|nr:uncharacterized protein HO173_009209 [Letharia columbiana]KAF6232541.1 hypothetical protein HO173_009209 [Letharia columbiana]